MYSVEKRDFKTGKWICAHNNFLTKNTFVLEGAQWIWGLCYCRVYIMKKFTCESAKNIACEFYCDSNFTLYINGNEVISNVKSFKGDISKYVFEGENQLNIVSNQSDTFDYFTGGIIGKIVTENKVYATDETWLFYRPAGFWENTEPENFSEGEKFTKIKTLTCPIHPRAYKRSLYVRKSFIIKENLKKATLYVSYKGEGESYINGKRTDDDILPQGINEKYNEYRSYDITNLLNKGENTVGFITANGWLNSESHTDVKMNKNLLIAEIETEYADGKSEIIGTDSSWKVALSPLSDNDVQYGERYSALNEIPDWCTPCPIGEWDNAEEITEETLNFVLRSYPPAKICRRIKPKAERPFNGGILFDFGVNRTGRYKISICGAEKGQQVRIEMFERFLDGEPERVLYGAVFFNNDSNLGNIAQGNVRNTDVYICKGGEESYEPHFTFTGFRYAVVYGLKRETITSFEMTHMHTALQKTGRISSGYKFIEKLFNATENTMYNNFLDGPMDCPTREKNFWTGDTQLFATTACFLACQEDFLARWTDGGRKMCQEVYGWGDEIYILPYVLYKFYGDINLLKIRYGDILHFAEERISASKDGLPYIYSSPFNDHLSPDRINVDSDFFAGAYYCYMLKTVGEIAMALGEKEDADKFFELSRISDRAFTERFYLQEENCFAPKTQTGDVLPLAFNIVPEELRQKVAESLVRRIEKDGHITCGYIGTRYIMDVLADYGYTSVIYSLLDREEFPSWKYILSSASEAGDTVTESWRGYAGPKSGSMDHFTLGSVTGWTFEYLAGIRWRESSPGFAKTVIKPLFIRELGTFEGEYYSKNGRIYVKWQFEGENAVCNIETETDGVFIFPDGKSCEFKKGKNIYYIESAN